MIEQGFDEPETGGGGAILAQLPSILWQRRWFIIIPLLLGLAGSIAAALLLPTRYQSTAVLLVQSPALPSDVIGQMSGDVVDERIERIRQQVISRPALLSLIETHQLYDDDRGKVAMSEIIERMREAITLTPQEVEVAGRPEDRTIAFTLAFQDADPVKAQGVTQSLLERILELNATAFATQSDQTVEFLAEQARGLERQIADLEGQVSALASRFGRVLGSGGAIISSNVGTFDMQIAALQRENVALAEQRSMAESSDNRDPAVRAAEAQLAALRAIYSESHPDVAIARRRLEEANQLAAQNVTRLPLDSIDRQIAFNHSQIDSLRIAKAQEQSRIESTLAAQARAPVIEQEEAQLQQRLAGLYEQYESVSNRLLAARAAATADDQQMGERLVVVDPPVVPDSPSSPNRPLIIAIGAAAGLGLGLVLALATEMFLHPIRDQDTIAAITGTRPLALVPTIVSESRRGLWRGITDRWRRPSARARASQH